MKTIYICAAYLLLSLSQVCGQVGKETNIWEWSEDGSHHNSIVEIESSGGVGAGVIVYVDKDSPVKDGFEGWCLTAWHVVSGDDGRREITVKYVNGRVAKRCKVLNSNESSDVALVWVWVPDSVSAVNISKEPANSNINIEICGLGGGSELDCCLRHFHCLTSDPTNDKIIYADVVLLPGDSGGPVFNNRKEVVGIVSGGWFWYDNGVVDDKGEKVRCTWPGRACNLAAINSLIAEYKLSIKEIL